MFAKRHRRPEQEEPLVPRGLIWQAMEEPSPADEPKRQERVNSLENRLHILPPPAQVPGSQSSVQASAPDADSVSYRPPFWHKAAKPDVVKPACNDDDPTISPLASIPLVATDSTERQKRLPFFRTLDPHKLELVTHPARRVNTARTTVTAAMRKFLRRWDAKVRVVNFRKAFGATIRRGAASLVEARGKISERRYSERLKRRIAWFATFVVAGAQKARAKTHDAYSELKARSRARFSKRQPKVHHDVSAELPVVKTLSLSPIARQGLQPRILAGVPLRVAVAFKRFLSRPETLQAIGRDSRLWTSFAMAGFSVLLLLGFVLIVKHYATEALPSHVLHIKSLTDPAPAEAAGVAPQKPSTPVQSARTTKRAAVPPRRATTPRVVKPKPRHTEDDDYVARDTFVSYENRRSSSR
jgi:hypothetical protein